MMKDDLIRRQAAIQTVERMYERCDTGSVEYYHDLMVEALSVLTSGKPKHLEIVRCKDCKHRPTENDRHRLVFPDESCPGLCEDFWYSWKPADNWFCANGEREDEQWTEEQQKVSY